MPRPLRLPLRKTPFLRRASHALVLACLGALAACGTTHDTDNPDWAQDGMPPPPKRTVQDREWQETEAPPPPAFDRKRLLALEMPPYMNLKFGVDPQTISLAGDGVVRYVIVAYREGSDALNAFYEGVRCSTEEVKTYARYSGGAWQPVDKPEWKRIGDMNSIYAKELAKQSLCRGHAPRLSVGDMVRELKQPEILTY